MRNFEVLRGCLCLLPVLRYNKNAVHRFGPRLGGRHSWLRRSAGCFRVLVSSYKSCQTAERGYREVQSLIEIQSKTLFVQLLLV